jgi:PPOX class probable F420-dependent enzyme
MAIAEHETPAAAPELLRPHINGKYLSLTTYRRDGSPVATPVWFADDGARFYVVTGADSYKVRRIRRNPSVAIAECTARGALRGEPIPARAEFLEEDEHARVDAMMARKYRVDRILILPLYRLVLRLRGKASDDRAGVYVAITPVAPAGREESRRGEHDDD